MADVDNLILAVEGQ